MANLPGIPYNQDSGNPSTGAPGSNYGESNPLDPTGAPTTDLVSGVSESAREGSLNYVSAPVGRFDGVSGPGFAGGNSNSTGVGEGNVTHNSSGAN